MKIIISPAKEMSFEKPILKNWKVSDKTKKIIQLLSSLDDDDLKNSLSINDTILKEVKTYISNFDSEITYQALDLYNGLVYRWMEKSSFDDKCFEYLSKNLIIFSALYGPIYADTNIKPYRLDMLSKIKIDNQNLKNYWKDEFNCIPRGETILNLASEEFSSLVDCSKYNWINFEFYEIKNGKQKKHSTISKKARGRMVKFLAKNQIYDLNLIKNFTEDGYSYSPELSAENKYTFVLKLD